MLEAASGLDLNNRADFTALSTIGIVNTSVVAHHERPLVPIFSLTTAIFDAIRQACQQNPVFNTASVPILC